MRFKPFTQRYTFSSEVLTKEFPEYMHNPLANWIFGTIRYKNVIKECYNISDYYLENEFRDELQLYFRENYPHLWSEAILFILQDFERTANFLAFCLQNYADKKESDSLEWILSQGGSGYETVKTDKNASEYDDGAYDLINRVSTVVKNQSSNALDANKLLQKAWQFCYSRNPDYEKAVSRCCDFLEKYLGDIYFPKDPKPQLKKFVYALEKTPNILEYKGDSIVNPKSSVSSLLKEASDIRGQHTNGKGRTPTKEESEFVLHTTIYIWNLHQK